ncbi:cation:proton antiporter [Candidatus Woesearchaeota archaeon]|nr:MAG: cation:proton antiporter [Candidatus Woesearchaeota archaeon]
MELIPHAMDAAFLMGLLIVFGGILALELGLSVAIVEILLGLLGANLFGMAEEQWIPLMANFGLLGIMFFAGFETDANSIRKNWKKSAVLGITSFFVPFLVFYLASFFIFNLSSSTSLVMAASFSPVSLAIIYLVLKENKMLSAPSGQLVLSAAMLVDVISMIVLSVVFEGVSFYSILVLFIVLLSLLFLPRFGRWLFSRYRGDSSEFKVKFILLTLIALLSVSEKINVHGAVLAFVAGFFFSEMIEEHDVLEEKLRAVIFGFMAPIFFFSAGLGADFSVLELKHLVFILFYAALVLSTKYFSSYFVFRRFMSRKISSFSGWLFSINVTLGIVFARVALHKGMIDVSSYSAVISVLVLTSVLASLAIRIMPHEI